MVKARIGSLEILITALVILSLMGIACARAAEPTTTPKPAATAVPAATSVPAAVSTATPVAGAPPVATPTRVPVPTPTAPATLVRPTEWTVIISEDLAEGDPLTEYGSNSGRNIDAHVFDDLILFRDPVGGTNIQPQPHLAESWEFPSDTALVLHLRKGVKFHNGEELTAEHAKWFYDAVLATNPPIRPRATLSPLGKAAVVDKYTIRWDMPETYAPALNALNSLKFVPFLRKEMSAAEFGKKAIGVGPYKTVQRERDKPVILESFDGYWLGKKAFPPRLVLRSIQEPATRLSLILAGQAQIAEQVPYSDLNRLRSNPKTEVITLKNVGQLTHHYNLMRPLWREKNVRLAVAYSVDRDLIVETVLEGNGSSHPDGWLLPGSLGWTDDRKPYPYDPAKAKALLKEMGLSQGFSFEWTITQGVYQKDYEIGEAAANQMNQAGIKAILKPTERARLLLDRNEAKYDLIELTWGWGWDKTGSYRTVLSEKGLNFRDPILVPIYGPVPEVLVKARELYNQAAATLDTAKRAAILERLDKFVAAEALFMSINTYDQVWGIQKDTRWRHPGVGISTRGLFFDLWEMLGVTPPK